MAPGTSGGISSPALSSALSKPRPTGRPAAFPTHPARPSSFRCRNKLTRATAGARFGLRLVQRDDLAGIHDVVGIKRALDRAHQLERDGRLISRQLIAFQDADAVLRADRATHLR